MVHVQKPSGFHLPFWQTYRHVYFLSLGKGQGNEPVQIGLAFHSQEGHDPLCFFVFRKRKDLLGKAVCLFVCLIIRKSPP